MSPPPKKRGKKIHEPSEELSSSTTPSPTELDDFFGSLLDKIESDSSDQDLLASLLTLKSWQKDLLVQLDSSQTELDQAWVRQERQERVLAALQYERDYLDTELETCRNFDLKFLKRLAKGETGSEQDDEEEALSNFLQANVYDPNHKQKIIARLHQELNARGGLERDLKLKQKELKSIQQEVQAKKNFLQSLPDHLASVERASLPLQKFMVTKNPSNDNKLLIGTDRQQRFQLAQTLPAPLYTLFRQLQHYLDRLRRGDDDDNNKEEECSAQMALSVTTAETDPQVVLQVPIPTINGRSSMKRVSIHFHYSSEHNLVSAVASGCSSVLQQDVLLEELFSQDVPENKEGVTGRPYHWCNYLAGLHMVPQQQQQPEDNCQSSTRVVVQELQRRVRANATLKNILQSLQRLHVPSRTKKKPATTCKLVKFTAAKTTDKSSLKKTYNVHLQCRDSQFQVQVCVNLARYPSLPPAWSLNPAKGDDATNDTPLYDAKLSALERFVNVTGLEDLVRPEEVEEDDENSRKATDESSYEDILLHQIRHIMETLGKNE